ncbi:hypothetical protein EDB83DRAFT_2533120 [Lactarius deliciosus]|nr:hypothetical protein EDB83DRAFT_2533120 [Lactarius deliciosus]
MAMNDLTITAEVHRYRCLHTGYEAKEEELKKKIAELDRLGSMRRQCVLCLQRANAIKRIKDERDSYHPGGEEGQHIVSLREEIMRAIPARKGDFRRNRDPPRGMHLLASFLPSLDIWKHPIKDVSPSYNAPVELFELIEDFLKCLNIYIKAQSTTVMTETVVKVLVELFATLTLTLTT